MNQEKKSKNKGKTIGLIIGVLAFAITYFGVKRLFKKDLADELKIAAIELNKQTPMEIDAYTRLDSATTIGKTNFIYHYTLRDLVKSDVNLEEVKNYIEPSVIQNVKISPDLKVYRDNNVTMNFKYYDKNGVFFTEISVTPELYNSK